MRKQVKKIAAASAAALALAGSLAWASLAKGGAGPAAARAADPRPPTAAEVSRGASARPPVPAAPAEAKPARVLAHHGLSEDGTYRDSALVEFDPPFVGAPLPGVVESTGDSRVLLRAAGGLTLEYAGLAEVFAGPGDAVRPGDPLGTAGGPVALRVERGGVTLDPVALLWPEMSRFAAEAGAVEEERARLAEVVRLARLAEEAASREAGQEGGTSGVSGSGAVAPPPHLDPLFEEASRETGLDPQLLKAVAAAESGFDPRAVSPKGALGLMQLMPGTARELGVSDPFDPEQNVRGGARYLRKLLDRFGKLDLALAAYNAGPGAVERHGGVPPYRETREYVQRVIRIFEKLGGDKS